VFVSVCPYRRPSANRTPCEEAAYFYLRRRGCVIIAHNFRSPNHRGELDLVGWEHDVLCFIEVKPRATRGMALLMPERKRRKRLITFVEIDRCATDAIGDAGLTSDLEVSRLRQDDRDLRRLRHGEGCSHRSERIVQSAYEKHASRN